MGAEQSCIPEPVAVTKKNVIKGMSAQEQAAQRRHDIYNKLGSTLHIAASHGDERQIRHLVKRGTDVNCRDVEHRTPFMMACKYGMLQTARLLIKFSANPDLTDRNDKTALDHTTHNHVKEWLTRYLRTRKLSEDGDMQIHNFNSTLQRKKTFSASNRQSTRATRSMAPSRTSSSSEGRQTIEDSPSRSMSSAPFSASSASTAPPTKTKSSPQLVSKDTLSTASADSTSADGARTLSSWKLLRPKSMFSRSASSETESTVGSVSAQSGAGEDKKSGFAKSWKKVRDSMKSGALARTEETPATTNPTTKRPVSTVQESIKSIKMECGKRPHERTQTDASQTAADVVHKLSDLDVCLGNDLTTSLMSSLNRSESAPRQGKGRK